MTHTIRPATRADLPEILAIYNHAVLHTTASYDYEPSTLERRTQWFEEHEASGLPVVVAVNDAGTVCGWGSLSGFRERIGYRFTVEHSVYVSADHRRQGIARLIVTAMIDAARGLGKHVVIGGVDANSEASVQLHRSLGFEEVGRLREVGYKFDRWLDVIFFQLMLT
jgi:phosphinothricin acetyltransferase